MRQALNDSSARSLRAEQHDCRDISSGLMCTAIGTREWQTKRQNEGNRRLRGVDGCTRKNLNKPAGPGSLEPAADAEHRTIRGFHGGGSNATQVSSSADDGRHLRGERNCRTTSGKEIESGSDGDCGLVQKQDFKQEVCDGKVNDFKDDQGLEARREGEAGSN